MSSKYTKGLLAITMTVVMTATTLLTGCSFSQKNQAASPNVFVGSKNPKYVFLFIGDGMGMPQINSAEIYGGAISGSKSPTLKKLDFTQFPVQGMNTTYASDSFIPDSASAGTAIATGNKTNDGVIAMDPEKTKKFKSMATMAKEKGMKVGIVSSVSLDHATPAVFYSNEPSRNNYYNIEMQLSKSNFDYFAGGGFKQPTGAKKDQPDAFEEAKKNGYKVVNKKEDINQLNSKSGKVIAFSPSLDGDKAIPFEVNKDKNEVSLADFTKKGIELLDNDKGFFMMVEGGKIDWACHANDAAASINDTLAFNDSVKQAIDFYNNHKDETLIVVTADHETGGMTLGFAGTQYNTFYNKISNEKVSYDVFAKKVDEYVKSHTADNAKIEDLLPMIKENYGLVSMDENEYNQLSSKAKDAKNPDKDAADKIGMALSPSDMNELKSALKMSMIESSKRPTDDQTYLLYGGYDPLTMSITHILNNKAGISFTSYAHTGVPVPVFAIGQGEDMFNGYFDDTDLNKKLVSIMGISK